MKGTMKRKEELQKEEILAPTDFPKKVRMYQPIFSSRSLLSKKRAYHIVKVYFFSDNIVVSTLKGYWLVIENIEKKEND